VTAGDHRWLATVRRHAQNAFAELSEDNPVGVPATRAFRFVLKTLEPILVTGE
jgi:hypothetical protein